jgi:hypothetical protein
MTRRLHCLLLLLPFAAATISTAAAARATTASDVAALPASAESAAAAAPELQTTTLDTIVVSGRQPGPGLWKVSRDGHVMWVLGTISPLPRRMEWASEEVEATVAASQEVLMPPSVSFTAEGAAFGGIFLIPSLMKARNNPDGEKLQDVLPAEDYARWTRLKQKYLGRDRGVEKRRPMMAGAKLQEEALDDEDLSTRDIATRLVEKVAKKHDVAITRPSVALVIKDAKAALREFRDTPLDDLDCFRRTLDRVENDIESMKLRANAWALGEVGILASLPYTDNFRACTDAVFETRFARQRGLDDLGQRVDAEWVAAAEQALAKNERTFAVVPMYFMLREGGLLAKLQARGYTVEAPDARARAEAEAEATEASGEAAEAAEPSGGADAP